MTAEANFYIKEPKKRIDAKIVLLLVILIIPSILVAVSIIYNYYHLKSNPSPLSSTSLTGQQTENNFIVPSSLLENKPQYLNQRVAIRGKVAMEPILCERKQCPAEDSCCGCDLERNLVVSDPPAFSSKTQDLVIVGTQGEKLCRRTADSCQYICPDWEMGSIYDLTGAFLAEETPPAAGMNIYFNMRFLIEEKKLEAKVTAIDQPGRIIESFYDWVKSLGSPSYVLP